MERISMKQLEAIVHRINVMTGQPVKLYVKGPDRYVAQIGCYHLSGAYGGYALHQMVNDAGGVRDVFSGHMPKRELAERMWAFIKGLESANHARSER